jgi:hypothetical protein
LLEWERCNIFNGINNVPTCPLKLIGKQLLGQPKRKATQEVGKRAPWTNNNILQTSNQGWVVTRPQIRVQVHKVFEMEIHYLE